MSIYDFTAKLGSGETRNLGDYRGQALLVVNVASKCGFTPQYKGLQELRGRFHPRGFEILAFPCDQFGHQEPGSDAESRNFASSTMASLSPFSPRSRSTARMPTRSSLGSSARRAGSSEAT
jgi:glutathione peroxidase